MRRTLLPPAEETAAASRASAGVVAAGARAPPRARARPPDFPNGATEGELPPICYVRSLFYPLPRGGGVVIAEGTAAQKGRFRLLWRTNEKLYL